ncbi:MAG: sigma factor [Pseudonocardiaceae bacterium]
MRRRVGPSVGRSPQAESWNPHAGGDSNDDLLLAAGRGDVGACADFYDRTASVVFGMLRGALGDSAVAEEATSRVYVRLWRTAPRFNPTTRSASSMLMRVTRRELVGRICDVLAPYPEAVDNPGGRPGTSP